MEPQDPQDPQQPQDAQDASTEQPQRTVPGVAELGASLDSRLRVSAADPRSQTEWWDAQATRIAGTAQDARLTVAEVGRPEAAFGPGGLVDVVFMDPVVRSDAFALPHPFRVVRRGSVTTPTAQVDAARRWLADRQFFVTGEPEHDDRIGVSRLQLTSDLTSVDLLRALRTLRYAVPAAGEQRLCIGPDDITMEGMHAKAAAGAGPVPVPDWERLGPRPRDGRGAGVAVAVIDGGFERQAKRRSDGWMDNVVAPPDDRPDPDDPALDTNDDHRLDDGAGHGTFVTGVLLQVAPAATVLQFRALDSWGIGNSWRLKDCLLDAAAAGARIINLSLGFDDVDLLGSPALSAALTSLPPDILVVAAAGNSGSPVPSLPASHSRCIGVGALRGTGPNVGSPLEPCAWSSFGPWVEFSCVGSGVRSTFVEEVDAVGTNPMSVWAGTSFAAPQISGLLAVELGRGRSPAEALAAVHHRAQQQTGAPHPDFGHMLRML